MRYIKTLIISLHSSQYKTEAKIHFICKIWILYLLRCNIITFTLPCISTSGFDNSLYKD